MDEPQEEPTLEPQMKSRKRLIALLFILIMVGINLYANRAQLLALVRQVMSARSQTAIDAVPA
jgi:hypothetical protein